MLESGIWFDTLYSGCSFMGARCKQQRLRHNIMEIAEWPVVSCHHVHDPAEWDPVLVNGERWYPSKEEAEYTACLAFAIATSVSLWAVRMGFGKMSIPRQPPVETAGRRVHWLHFDPLSLARVGYGAYGHCLGFAAS